jgi:hypothetical protein
MELDLIFYFGRSNESKYLGIFQSLYSLLGATTLSMTTLGKTALSFTVLAQKLAHFKRTFWLLFTVFGVFEKNTNWILDVLLLNCSKVLFHRPKNSQ